MVRNLIVIIGLALISTSAFAQEKPTPGDEMIYKYLCVETDKFSRKFLDGAATLAEWQQKRPRLYREYMDMLGLWPIPEKTPLKATVTGIVEAHGVVVEKLHFQSKPGLYVTANLYRPKASRERQRPEKLPAIVYVCGHSARGRDGNKSAFQDHGFWFANNGYVCIMLDSLQLGEIPGVHHGTYGRTTAHFKAWGKEAKPETEPRWWWHSSGYTPAGVECWNGVRAIDYLVTRPEVDPDRIGVTGISGGGASTCWIACADERVKVAVPVSGMTDLECLIKNKIINGHCDCMFPYNTYQWDLTTIPALIAPRPLLFANSDKDPIFPMDGNRRIIEKLRRVYEMYDRALYGKPQVNPPTKIADLVQEYVSVGGHDYRPDLRVAIFKFINKHLKGDTTTPVEDSAKYKPLPGKELRVFPTDDDLPKDVWNGKIDEIFVSGTRFKIAAPGGFENWKSTQLRELKQRVFRALPEIMPAAKGIGGVYARVEIETEPGISCVLVGLIEKGKIVTLHIVNRDDIEGNETPDWLKKWDKDVSYGFAPRGIVEHWKKKSPPNYVERSHALLGQTVDEGRLRDILATLKLSKLAADANAGVRLLGRGQAGILAAYAALFEPSIKEVVVINPPKSHKEGPHFLGVLRVLDIPEALGLLAPTKLTIIGGRDAAFDRTAEIYRLAGAENRLIRK